MKKIKLMKNHEENGVTYKEGEVIEVSDDQYEWLMSVYMADRNAQVQDMKAGEERIKKWTAGVTK